MEDSGVGGPGCPRSAGTSKKEEVERILKDVLLAVGAGSVEADGMNAWVFVEVFKDKLKG